MQGQGLEMCREQFLAAACPWHRAKGNMALPAPTSPGHQTCSEDGKKKKKKEKEKSTAPAGGRGYGVGGGGAGGRMACASSLPLEAVRGTAGWRRAGVIPTTGAGRRSRRWLRGAPAQAKEGQEAVGTEGSAGRCTGRLGQGQGFR